MNQHQVDRMIAALVGESGAIHYSDFMAKLCVAQRGVRDCELSKIFQSIDLDGSGTLDMHEIETLLARPNMARLMEGRSAADLLREMDSDNNGVIDFQEFSRAMLGERNTETWSKGDFAKYFSGTHNSWLPCRIHAVDQNSGAVIIDIKAGHWLPLEYQQTHLLRSSEDGSIVGNTLRSIGQKCRYFSRRQGSYFDGLIIDVD